MTLLSELYAVLSRFLPVETGVFSGQPPDAYIVITPLSDTFEVSADDLPQEEVQEARVSIFCKGSYTGVKNRIVRALLKAGITVTDRRYISRDDSTEHHHYVIDTAKEYHFEMEE